MTDVTIPQALLAQDTEAPRYGVSIFKTSAMTKYLVDANSL